MPARARWFAAAPSIVGLAALVRDLALTPYDDSYFFKRFALNFLHHGVFAWNVADGPVHGITSQLFQVVSVTLAWIAPQHFVIAGKLLLAACLCTTGWMLAHQCVRIAGRDAAALLAVVVLCTPPVLAIVHTGTETALALLLVAWSLDWVGDKRRRPARAALCTLLAYLCRPDAALIPALAFAIAHARERASLLRYFATLLAGLGACLLAFRAYYGTALPLPFYLKTFAFSPYGDAMAQLVVRENRAYLTTFAAIAAPSLYIAAQRVNRLGAALLIAAAAFVAYHALTNNQIMGYRARFYLPALIPLVLAAALAWDEWIARHSPPAVAALDRPPFDDYCRSERPEIIFLPHKSYAALNREIKQSRCIAGYTRAVKRSSTPMYIRNDLAPSFLACATDSTRYR